MEPLETGFMAPTIDFFKPRRTRGIYDFIGIESGKNGLYMIFHENPYSENQRRKRHRAFLPPDVINSIYVNDLGSLSFDFADKVKYRGNSVGAVTFDFPDTDFSIPYDAVARVKKGDKVVWENGFVPQEKRLLQTASS